MLSDPDTHLEGGEAFCLILFDVVPKLHLNSSQIVKPLCKQPGRIYPRKIKVALPKAKPPAHLHQRVVLERRPYVVAHDEAFERESTRQSVPPYDHHLQASVAVVV